MGQTQSQTIRVPSRLDQVASVQKAIVGHVCASGHGPDTQFAVRLALDEALANAILHGNGNDPTKEVTVEYTVTADDVRIQVCDEGNGFNPTNVPDPTLPENLCKPNGRGIMLMRAYMKDIRYNECGNCVTLVMNTDAKSATRARA